MTPIAQRKLEDMFRKAEQKAREDSKSVKNVDVEVASYEITEDDRKRLDNNFTYHSPNIATGQPNRYEKIRSVAKAYAERICTMCPPSRERSLALTKLEEVVMWANAAIARNE